MNHQIESLLFTPGPLHEKRMQLEVLIKQIPVKTGDIFCRLGMQKIMGLPFEKLVAKVTKSHFSHASVAMVMNNEVYLLEVNDMGTMLIRFVDWLSYCGTEEFSIYRLPLNEEGIGKVHQSIEEFISQDPDYDYKFLPNNDKFYCTESVFYIYQKAGFEISPPVYLKEIMTAFKYRLVYSINWVVNKLFGKSLPMDVPAHFVGNAEHGILSTKGIEMVFDSISTT